MKNAALAITGIVVLAAWPALAQATGAEPQSLEATLLRALIEHGPIGIACALLVMQQRTLYRDAREDRAKYDFSLKEARDDLKNAHAAHKTQIDEMAERSMASTLEFTRSQADQTKVNERMVRLLEKGAA